MADNDFIPQPDGSFDEWQKNYVKQLSSPWPPREEGAPTPVPAPGAAPVRLLYGFLGIPADKYGKLIEKQADWTKDYARGGKEADRRSSDTVEKQESRNEYEEMLRSITAEYIRSSTKENINRIKRALKLTVPDTEPSLSHGSHLATGAPKVSLENMGGSVIDIRCERITDADKGSVPENHGVELRWIPADIAPLTPDDAGMKTEVYSKARNQITTGMQNLKKTFYCWLRWKHKTNAAFNSPWSDLKQITIS